MKSSCFLLFALVTVLCQPGRLMAQKQLQNQPQVQPQQQQQTDSSSRVVTGRITSIVVDDPASQPDTTSAERRFAVRLTLDSVEGTVLGFAPRSNSGAVEIQQAMLDTALLAFEQGWPVALSLEHPLTASANPRARGNTRSHVRIVAIMIRRP